MKNAACPEIHEQTWVKVNTTVDKGISRLIEALSDFPKLKTIESCQGTKGWAWVCFDYGDGSLRTHFGRA
jgi:hypothetical protein